MLRERGLAFAEKKLSRDASQGLIGLRVCNDTETVTMIEFNCETDFVAKTDRFMESSLVMLDTV